MAHFISALWHWQDRCHYRSKLLPRFRWIQRAATAVLIVFFANGCGGVRALAAELYGTSLNTAGADLLVTINPATGQITSIAFPWIDSYHAALPIL